MSQLTFQILAILEKKAHRLQNLTPSQNIVVPLESISLQPRFVHALKCFCVP